MSTARADQPERGAPLREYLPILGRRKWVILQAVVVIPLVAIVLSLQQQKEYEATAQVLLGRQNLAASLTSTQDPNASTQDERLVDTQVEVARVSAVATAALARIHLTGRTPEQLLGHSSVEAKPNADLLIIHVTDPDPKLAAQLANAYAASYVDYRRKLDTSSIARARRNVQVRLDGLARTGERRSKLYTQLFGREQQLAEMEALLTSQANVIQQARSARQVSPRPVRNGFLGLALGLVIGLGMAYVWEILDTRVRSAEEVGERLGGLPLLARLPEPSKRFQQADALAMLEDPGGAEAEPYRILRTNLEFGMLDRDVRKVMVTSAVEREGKSTTLANLAIAAARAGKRVVLVDLDLRKPYLNRFFDLDGPGITQVALGRVSIDEALVRVEFAGSQDLERGSLEVLTAGPPPPDPGEFVGGQALSAILDAISDRCDLVLVDAPPVLHVGDAMALSPKMDGIVVVTRLGVVRRPMLHDLHRQIRASPAHLLGYVITGAAEEGGYGYGYGYGYGQHGSPERASRLG